MNQPRNNPVLTFTLDVFETIRIFWWRFFDWLAVVSWLKLILISLLVFIITAPSGFGALGALFFWGSIAIKSLAGGKRKAEIAASAATTRADVEALQRSLLEAQMATLQAQIEPHFLFNTLALIGQLIQTNPADAAKIHSALIQYLRAALPQIREKGGSKLGQQVEMSRAYLNIMQARMGERLGVSIDVAAELAELAFPSMMLQTLVENSIKHGLEPKIEGGHIQIRGMRVGQDLQVEVSDNGVGFDLHTNEGIGLSNIRERLNMLYGSNAQLIVEVPHDGGSRVSIRIPCEQ
ncbi:histidine kinase [Undibacterium piscinae]|uniref:Histidine kinase n=1 Tax=Undibacterium piscinae TaxID=2495591 RepID=A0A6M4A6L4_9BURK|nr:histidine kinase [Undibacterium piscinae]